MADCIELARRMKLCIGDRIIVSLRTKGFPNTVNGVLSGYGEGAIIVENDSSEVLIYLREVKTIIKVKDKNKDKGGKD